MAQSVDKGLKTYNFQYSHTARSHSEYTTKLTTKNSGTYTALLMRTIIYYLILHNTTIYTITNTPQTSHKGVDSTAC